MMTMDTDKHISRWYQNLWAALIFFTRLPFWRVYQPPQASYKAVVEYWPLSGWITGGIMAATIYLGNMVFPWPVVVVMAVVVRLLVTGALHEDGLTDFFDGLGGGTNRDRILAIMKDSHIGTYGVIGLILYLFLLGTSLCSMTPRMAVLAVLAADPFAKMVSCLLVVMLPYARREEEAKSKTVYRKVSIPALIGLTLQGLLPMVLMIWLASIGWFIVVLVPCVVMYFLYRLIRLKIGGYTGDCCGAVCLLVELSIYLVISSLSFAK